MRLKKLMAILFSLFLIGSTYGQGWEQLYHEDTISTKSIEMTADSGFFIAATREPDYGAGISGSAYLIRIDLNGDTLWTKRLEDMSVNGTASVPGGYVLGGDTRNFLIPGSYFARKGRLIKVDLNGDTIWTKSYPYFTIVSCDAVIQTTDGGYLLAGSKRDGSNWNLYKSDVYVIKTNTIGDTIWTKTYAGIGDDYIYSVLQTADGGYLMVGETESSGAGNKDVYVMKIDALGNVTWTQTYGGAHYDGGTSVIQTTGGGYLIAGYTQSSGAGNKDAYLVKIDATGNITWTQTYGGSNEDVANSVVETTDGGYLLAGYSRSFGNADVDVYVVKTNFLGVEEWFQTYGNTEDDYGTKGILASDGYAIVGWHNYRVGNLIEGNIYLVKTDSLGNTYTNYIKGNIFSDTSGNCLKELGEPNLDRILVQAVGNRTWYGTTDSLGNYCIKVDTGTYVVTANVPTYWQTCSNSITTIPLYTPFVNDTIDFPFQAQIDCPLMRVDLSAPLLRASIGSNYTISYCNEGTVDASNVVVKVDLDADLIVQSTSIPFSSVVNNEYTFNIGTVARGACGSFRIRVLVNGTAILGQTHCSEAHIFPDSLCFPIPWAGGFIDASATCQNDSIDFKLENIGAGLFNSETYYVFEDHVIMRTGNTGNVPVSGSFDLTIPADTGKTYRISVAQNSGFPKLIGDTIASAAVEGCVPYLNGTFNTGFITQFSNGNSSPFIAVDCQPNRGSFDPNDKTAQPAGYDTQHYIYNYTDLDYKIRFQNTGTDTAFLVVIRDEISPLLDLTTLKMGASSHDYTWRVYGEGILEIRFENILLPDSTTNEPESNGFVRYRIEQKTGNIVGDYIYNAADIYFDANAPIRTNQTYHRIGEHFVTILADQTLLLEDNIAVKVYPNPFTQNATIEVEGKDYNELQLTIYDVSGRVVLEKQTYTNNKIELSRGNLQPGVYFYQLLGDDALINTGKIVVQ